MCSLRTAPPGRASLFFGARPGERVGINVALRDGVPPPAKGTKLDGDPASPACDGDGPAGGEGTSAVLEYGRAAGQTGEAEEVGYVGGAGKAKSQFKVSTSPHSLAFSSSRASTPRDSNSRDSNSSSGNIPLVLGTTTRLGRGVATSTAAAPRGPQRARGIFEVLVDEVMVRACSRGQRE